ncbi:MAG: hypothetical protein ACD_31C00005G0011 [uncultured bacterium]|uniref:Uncharacterized protein n=3 Tax=Candidatus Daviesiibacteriota TaxID=1752718 RepID=A0A0G0I3E1_9BACT|nr:MAG: hypothetical protein ACD_31C00005G0011 [uncultured bacterium]KKQ10586.1 MAG: hypothetical protein US19_C0002G0005 [Candidatus Daviesbacteria bacterium GW2011_GWB1_36_5]KKQ15715.1 MAG: hypothetical protein US28_C0011G0011 [Candidatus Daviesbacteria bacterium GW2011_GWA1_36_8]OGE17866.1 MAG: hypothetical protein A2858_03925 [Candidatus Daviesbacteria bacterium RIFCSPHIGHO2_01_FULL_36_37]
MNIPYFFINPQSHFMAPGAVAFIPGWIWLEMIIFIIVVFKPNIFKYNSKSNQIISPYLFVFIIGSLMPAFDDILAFLFGPPFAHHSLFHSILGSLLTFLFFRTFSNKKIALFALAGNLLHTLFNFYLDYVSLFFPLTYQEFGLTDILKISTYWLKVINYPIILILFIYSIFKYLLTLKK